MVLMLLRNKKNDIMIILNYMVMLVVKQMLRNKLEKDLHLVPQNGEEQVY